MSAMNSQIQWQRVLERDARFDGAFVYAVQTTGVYCRPSCPSRRPKPNVVQFFPAPEQAENAGFRACRRCKPRDPRTVDQRVQMVVRACELIEQQTEEQVSLQKLGEELGRSPFEVQRLFKQVLGISPRQYADTLRLRRLKSELRGPRNVTESLYEAGYGSSSRLYERAHEQLGMTPAQYRAGAAGQEIRYTIARSPLGLVLVGATERGVCAVSLGDSEKELLANLKADFPAAELRREGSALRDAVETVLAIAGETRPGAAGVHQSQADLPLDLRATAFQRRVWELLRKIPAGQTRSYSDIARELGTGPRAVARACASNRVALLVPCHRVVRGDGDIGGYKWGVERKKALLARDGR
ncbi:MAG TPA: bifunctional DNA-binding transcriptional regulator/O6-methylguanine-DNA methyltransferase Ada [Terriglobales bacterium]|nr:bifunctional DNA-binding transcriptional regulator/O6-methylguanine-DNA methyltransferase Ada [Terriglobales bacterium]